MLISLLHPDFVIRWCLLGCAVDAKRDTAAAMTDAAAVAVHAYVALSQGQQLALIHEKRMPLALRCSCMASRVASALLHA